MAMLDKIGRWVRLPKDPLFRLLVINGFAGMVVAALVLGGIFWANIGNLRVLVLTAEDPILPVLMLGCGLVITLGSVVIGSAIMLLGDNHRSGGTPRRTVERNWNGKLRPLPITAGDRPEHIR